MQLIEQYEIFSIIDYYRIFGHHFARVDPLEYIKNENKFPSASEFGLDLDQIVDDILKNDEESYFSKLNIKTVGQLEEKLKEIYTGPVGVEFEHIQDQNELDWLYTKYEQFMSQELLETEKLNIHYQMIQTEAFDHFLHKKFSTFKRYSMEGSETMLVCLRTIFGKASEKGWKDIVLSMPHRGRLNVLVNLMDYPVRNMLAKIMGKSDFPKEIYNKNDDIVSHLAISVTKTFLTGSSKSKEKDITVSMIHNPSHLELNNSIGLGKTKAKQFESEDKQSVLHIQLHGDAAHSAQGIVYETYLLAKVPKFNVGGTIHIIVNNQMGFTTSAVDGRSSKYCTDIGKSFDIPILHVNGDDPESIFKVAKFCIEYREKYQKDIIIDIMTYRRYGHNELDEPQFTQPQMYRNHILKHPGSPQKYDEKLLQANIVKQDSKLKIQKKVTEFLEKEIKEAQNFHPTIADYKNEKSKGNKAFTKKWSEMTFSQYGQDQLTGIDTDLLSQLGRVSVELPTDFQVHQRLEKFFIQDRLKQIEAGIVDWATAEALAILTLLNENYNVRLSGQDVERGTFSQRHMILVDQNDEKECNPIKEWANINKKGRIQINNSPLSETSVMSFEFGFSMENPRNLSIWEAQFGDFFNVGQSFIDTFFVCSEYKWLRQSGMVILLPHGYDGAGPEHSNCRVERFLQQINSDGINELYEFKEHNPNRKDISIQEDIFYANHQDISFQVVNPSTPSNYFHVLRRQMKRNFRKPLLVVAPKTLLRNTKCRSSLKDMGHETSFQSIIAYPNDEEIKFEKQVVFLISGKYRYDLQQIIEQNQELKQKSAVLIIEELAPFPEQKLSQYFAKLNKDVKIVWVQEEPMNSGCYQYVKPHIRRIQKANNFTNQEVEYCGRKSNSCVAIGYTDGNRLEMQDLINKINSY